MSIRRVLPSWLKRAVGAIDSAVYPAVVVALSPLNAMLARANRRRVRPGSVLHVSGMVHVAHHTVQILRECGVAVDYLAVGDSPWWNTADFHFRPTPIPIVSALKEMWWVWRVVSRYAIVHAHFGVTVTRAGWELPLLKRMGRSVVVHFRGCEIRDPEENQRRHPDVNICQECDYQPRICTTAVNVNRRRLASAYGDVVLVTTPDLREFAPGATHMRFFAPPPSVLPPARPRGPAPRPLRIVHATNHPGIEGTVLIRRAVDALSSRGYAIEFRSLHGVTHAQVLDALADADVSIGKMKMGFYANAQIESLAMGVPAITWIRDEFMSDDIRRSGLIVTTLDRLEATLERLITHPEELEAKRRVARDSVSWLHPNRAIAEELKMLYRRLGPA